MRTRYYLNITITFLLLALLCSCHRRHDVPLHPSLQRADSLMQQHPDSALALLSRFNSRSFKDRYQQEAYRVLLVQANDRCYQPIVLYKKDMANAVSYFDSSAVL